MDKLVNFTGIVAPLDRANIDTDAIIPKQFLKSIERVGFGPFLFDEWRYMDHGEPGMDCSGRPLNPEFVLNQPRYAGASVLVTRDNFGCGSSREHAPWALLDFGIRVIVAPSFADIFYNNCFKNGILPVVFDGATVERLLAATVANEGYTLTLDLPAQTLSTSTGEVIAFEIDPLRKNCLLEGLDDIGLTLQHVTAIGEFESRHHDAKPWLFS